MIQLISNKITDKFIKYGVIVSEEKELYSYGFQQGIIMIFNILTTIIIGLVFGMLEQSIVFMLAYIPLRSYAGGYHAKTQLRCYFYSSILTIAALLGITYIPWSSFIYIIIILMSGGIIFFLSPVEDANKPLNNIEIKIYKMRVRFILLIQFICIIILGLLKQEQFLKTILTSILILSVMLILGKCKNIHNKSIE